MLSITNYNFGNPAPSYISPCYYDKLRLSIESMGLPAGLNRCEVRFRLTCTWDERAGILGALLRGCDLSRSVSRTLSRPVEECPETDATQAEGGEQEERKPSKAIARAKALGARVLRAIPFQQLKIIIGKQTTGWK